MTTTPFDGAPFAPNKISHYEVTNRRTGKVTTYKTSAAASNACNRMDNAYGAYICTRKAIWSDQAA